MGKWLCFSESQFSYLENGGGIMYLTEWHTDYMHIKHLSQCQEHSIHSRTDNHHNHYYVCHYWCLIIIPRSRQKYSSACWRLWPDHPWNVSLESGWQFCPITCFRQWFALIPYLANISYSLKILKSHSQDRRRCLRLWSPEWILGVNF